MEFLRHVLIHGAILDAQWGQRHDRDVSEEELLKLGFRAAPAADYIALPPYGRPLSGLNLTVDQTTYLLFNNERHVIDPMALGRLTAGQLPFAEPSKSDASESS